MPLAGLSKDHSLSSSLNWPGLPLGALPEGTDSERPQIQRRPGNINTQGWICSCRQLVLQKPVPPLLPMGLNRCLLRTAREEKEQNTSPLNTREERAAIWLTDYLSRQIWSTLNCTSCLCPSFTLSLARPPQGQGGR